jgi:FkbM family methyltransferase
MNLRPHSTVVPAVLSPPIGPIGDFTVVDVGASGGIAGHWSAFGDALAAVAFDPLVTNMKKMAAAERRSKVTYEAAFVGCHDFDRLFPPELRQVRVDPYLRASSTRAQELMRVDFVADHFNEGDELVWSDRHITLDEYFPAGRELDFLKIDTDGSDLQVLLGAERLFRGGAFLGIMIEAQFQGWPHDYANTFANIDRFLRSVGYQLYDVDLNRYTRAVLPGLFEYDITAQTQTGQVLWGDALYFRDLAHPSYESSWRYAVTRERLLKLVALFDLHGLPDCAAELLLVRADLTSEADRTLLLDRLVASAGFETTYAEHRRRFEEHPESFFPRAYRAPSKPPAVAAQPARGNVLGSRVRALKRLLGV